MMINTDSKIARIDRALEALQGSMASCSICPRNCGANRTLGEAGYCYLPDRVRVYKYKLHFGEEPPISGTRGSGIVFFAGCTMRCVFCQNYPMSHLRQGYEISQETLAKIFLQLQELGAHNINLVTPTQFLPQILAALRSAYQKGLRLPVVYNSNGYEKLDILRLLDGIVDVYLPDAKYASDAIARRYSKCPNYVAHNRAALKEMFRQAGLLQTDVKGIAKRGLIVRHLILPNNLDNTRKVLEFLARDLSPQISLSLMTQYLPIWGAPKYREINRRLNRTEFEEAMNLLDEFGFENGWFQEL